MHRVCSCLSKPNGRQEVVQNQLVDDKMALVDRLASLVNKVGSSCEESHPLRTKEHWPEFGFARWARQLLTSLRICRCGPGIKRSGRFLQFDLVRFEGVAADRQEPMRLNRRSSWLSQARGVVLYLLLAAVECLPVRGRSARRPPQGHSCL